MPKQGEGKTFFPLMLLGKVNIFIKSAKLIDRKYKNLWEKNFFSPQCFLTIVTKTNYYKSSVRKITFSDSVFFLQQQK